MNMNKLCEQCGKRNLELLEKYHVTAVDKNGETRIPVGQNKVTVCGTKTRRKVSRKT